MDFEKKVLLISILILITVIISYVELSKYMNDINNELSYRAYMDKYSIDLNKLNNTQPKDYKITSKQLGLDLLIPMGAFMILVLELTMSVSSRFRELRKEKEEDAVKKPH